MRLPLAHLTALASIVLVFGLERTALARCGEGSSRVELVITGASADLERSLRAELGSELEREKLCATAPQADKPALARIEIAISGDADATVRIVDAVTKKTVERRVDVAGLPADGRALPIAISADELLRASWAEINLASAEKKQSDDVPKVVRESVGPAPTPSKPAFGGPNELGLRFSPAIYGGGQSHLGGALYYSRDLVSWLSAEIFGYGREGLVAHATDGTIRAHTGGGGLSMTAHVLRTGPLRLGPRVGVEVGYVLFEGVPTGGATGTHFGGVTSFGALGLASTIEVTPVRISLSASALAPFRTAKAVDGSKVATAASGAGFTGGLGVGVGF